MHRGNMVTGKPVQASGYYVTECCGQRKRFSQDEVFTACQNYQNCKNAGLPTYWKAAPKGSGLGLQDA